MHAVYIGNHKMLGKMAWGGKLFFSSEDMSLMPDFVANGLIEIGLTKYLLNNLQANQTFLDIGSNVGYYTVLAGLKVGAGGKVFAFEANPKTYEFVRDNVAINYINPQTEVYNKAVYSENKEISFYSTERFSGNASIHKPDQKYYDYFLVDKGLIEHKVEAIKMDDFIQDKVIDYVKVDIEGGEYHCLLGMKESIKKGLVQHTIFEVNQVRSDGDSQKLYELLKTFQEEVGMEFYVIGGNGEAVRYPLDKIFQHEFIPAVLMKKTK